MAEMEDGKGEPPVERFREYLLMLARMQVGQQAKARLDASDVVQQTLLEAYTKRDQFRGSTDAELMAWLRKMLACRMTDARRALGRAKRDVGREVSMEARIKDSTMRLEAWVAGRDPSPSQKLKRDEQVLELVEALAQLPDAQREALTMRHCQGMTLEEISQQMQRSPVAVAGLIKRGLASLREIMRDKQSE